MRISDWSSDVCSSDLYDGLDMVGSISTTCSETFMRRNTDRGFEDNRKVQRNQIATYKQHGIPVKRASVMAAFGCNYEGEIAVSKVVDACADLIGIARSEEHTSELQSLMRSSYAVFCLKKNNK